MVRETTNIAWYLFKDILELHSLLSSTAQNLFLVLVPQKLSFLHYLFAGQLHIQYKQSNISQCSKNEEWCKWKEKESNSMLVTLLNKILFLLFLFNFVGTLPSININLTARSLSYVSGLLYGKGPHRGSFPLIPDIWHFCLCVIWKRAMPPCSTHTIMVIWEKHCW